MALAAEKITPRQDFNTTVLYGIDIAVRPQATISHTMAAANEHTFSTERHAIGDKMPDGTILAGLSPETGRPMYVAPTETTITAGFNGAAKYADELRVGLQKGFHIPTKRELNVLFQNREIGALRGTFNQSGDTTQGIYWSSTTNGDVTANGKNEIWAQDFSNGKQNYYVPDILLATRLVRS